MELDTKAMIRGGVIWGLVALVVSFISGFIAVTLPGISALGIGSFATMFAGIHYVATRKEGKKSILSSIVGGALAGLIAALFLIAAGLILQFTADGLALTLQGIAGVLITGLIGALGMEVVQRIG
ncbi:MAG: hypothetical protein GYB68_15640 [Chloroflexi bacterium]|nr:hypothetical protein [Chloroflexota bacterium]